MAGGTAGRSEAALSRISPISGAASGAPGGDGAPGRDLGRQAEAYLVGVDLGRHKVSELAGFVEGWVHEGVEVSGQLGGDLPEIASAALDALWPLVEVLAQISGRCAD